MNHGKDMQPVALYLVDKTVTVEESFAHMLIVQFWHHTSKLWLLDNRFGNREEFLGYPASMVGGIATDVFGNGRNVIKRFVRPDQSCSHFRNRTLASSWV